MAHSFNIKIMCFGLVLRAIVSTVTVHFEHYLYDFQELGVEFAETVE